MQYLAPACRITLGLVFAAAVAGKLRNRSAFADSVEVLLGFRRPAVLVVCTEAVIVVLLMFPQTASAGLMLAGAVLLVFCAGIARAMRSGRRASCHCFGLDSSPLGGKQLIRNAGLLVVVACGFTTGSGPARPGGLALSAAVAAVLALLAVFFDDIADLFVPPKPR